ncbi:hypothetical protein E2C01_047069 [Portunus trituberculatus]|uniref:Uncharacterized protein n=1 Tax=Portunus trituberculatus TaxID=210409 RepID=A0A5B7G7K7_PORTR|nr:hypothetical protein [Portunus trituberculatus]
MSDLSPKRRLLDLMPSFLMASSSPEAGPSWRPHPFGCMLLTPSTTTTTTSITSTAAAIATTPPSLLTASTSARGASRASLLTPSPVHTFVSATSPHFFSRGYGASSHVTCVTSTSPHLVSTQSYVTASSEGGATSLSVKSPSCVTATITTSPTSVYQRLQFTTHR